MKATSRYVTWPAFYTETSGAVQGSARPASARVEMLNVVRSMQALEVSPAMWMAVG